MKKLFFTAILTVACVLSAAAQENVLSKGSSIVSLGIGLPETSALSLPLIAATYEYGVADFGLSGSVGVGASVGIYGYADNGILITPIGVRGAYHYTVKNNWEIYGGAALGIELLTFDYLYGTDTDVDFMYQVFAGTRYMFSNSIGAFLEFGYGVSYATIGVSFKF